jgi:hypothetical protein
MATEYANTGRMLEKGRKYGEERNPYDESIMISLGGEVGIFRIGNRICSCFAKPATGD